MDLLSLDESQALGATRRIRNPISRLMSRVRYTAYSCWEWTGSTDRKGYGKIRLVSRTLQVHRFSYEVHRGKIPDGFHIDHLCRNPRCLNPWHLEVVTPKENQARGLVNQHLGRMECRRGHPFDEGNTGRDRWGHRVCRSCLREYRRAYQRAYYHRKKNND